MVQKPPGIENNQNKTKSIKRGGVRPGSGRKRGSVDRATAEQKATLSELARTHTKTALDTLVRVARNSESDSAAVSAAVAILDRGYGKPAQSVEVGGPNGSPIEIADVSDLQRAKALAVFMARTRLNAPK